MSDTPNLIRLMASAFEMPQRNKDLIEKAADEMDALAKQLATAREDALREASEIAANCGVTPMTNVAHGGADWYRHGKEISRRILDLTKETQDE